MAGGASTGALTGWVGSAVGLRAAAWLGLAGLLLLALRELGWKRIPLLQSSWVVPAKMLNGSVEKGGLIWGAILGCGLLTPMRFSALAALHILILWQGSILLGAVAAGVFGFSRAAIVLINPDLLRSGQAPLFGLGVLNRHEWLVRSANGWSILGVAVALALIGILEGGLLG